MISGAYTQGAEWLQPNSAQHTRTQHELLRSCASVGTGPRCRRRGILELHDDSAPPDQPLGLAGAMQQERFSDWSIVQLGTSALGNTGGPARGPHTCKEERALWPTGRTTMLLGETLAIGGGMVGLLAMIALMIMLGDPMADVPGSRRSAPPRE